MSDAAAHLVDRVLPEVPVRQWVLSLPYPLRFGLAYDRQLCTKAPVRTGEKAISVRLGRAMEAAPGSSGSED
jgi:hypothetical protein